MLACPPSIQDIMQVKLWKKLIAYEKSVSLMYSHILTNLGSAQVPKGRESTDPSLLCNVHLQSMSIMPVSLS